MGSGDIYKPGEGILNELQSVINDYAEANTPEWVNRVNTLISKLNRLRKARIKKACEQQPLTESLRSVCLDWGVHPVSYSHIRKAYFSINSHTAQPTVLSEKSEHFYYNIGGAVGSKHAQVNTVTIDWGDGKTDTILHSSGYPHESAFYTHSTQHTYKLPQSIALKEYTVTTTVVGDNDPGGTHKHEYVTKVVVTIDTEPLQVKFTTGASLLRVNQQGTWEVDVAGGAPPFEMNLDWDTQNDFSWPLTKENRNVRTNRIRHGYSKEGHYTITFSVKDAKGDEVSATYDVLIGTGPDSEYLILDRIEYYAYNNDCGDTGACWDYNEGESWWTKKSHYDISEGKAQFTADYIFHSVKEVDYTADFTFDTPPGIIKKGSTLSPLSITATASGETKGWFLDRGIYFYSKASATANRTDHGYLKISNREMPYNETTGYFKGSKSKSTSVEITIPEEATDGFMITTKHGWDPGLYITWVYISYQSP